MTFKTKSGMMTTNVMIQFDTSNSLNTNKNSNSNNNSASTSERYKYTINVAGTLDTVKMMKGPYDPNLKQCALIVNHVWWPKLRVLIFAEDKDKDNVVVVETASKEEIKKILSQLSDGNMVIDYPAQLYAIIGHLLSVAIERQGVNERHDDDRPDNVYGKVFPISSAKDLNKLWSCQDSKLKYGDLLSRRINTLARHYGIYIGGGQVLHYGHPESGTAHKKTGCKKADMCSVGVVTLRWFQRYSENGSFAPRLIVQRQVIPMLSPEKLRAAIEAAKKTKIEKYSLFKCNCEHFARGIVFDGHSWSAQVEDFFC